MSEDLWARLGFASSPYDVRAISPSKRGDELLVGRDDELRTLKAQITSSSLHPCLDGENGVGKTSLVAVAGYQLKKDFAREPGSPAFLPVERVFQLTEGVTFDAFSIDVAREIAKAFLLYRSELDSAGFSVPTFDELSSWVDHGSGTEAFGRGLRSTVESWLARCFPTPQSGGFICTLDNLELLKSSAQVRNALEEMRDGVLSWPGLRWVLCGSRGIVRFGTSSTRLEGRLATPLTIEPLSPTVMPMLIARRIAAFRIAPRAVAPVQSSGFKYIYDVLHDNLRNALRYADDFSVRMFVDRLPPADVDDCDGLLRGWLAREGRQVVNAVDAQIGADDWQILEKIGELGGSASTKLFEELSFTSAKALRPHLAALERVGVLSAVVRDGDRRLKNLEVTPRGWLALHSRSAVTALPSAATRPLGELE